MQHPLVRPTLAPYGFAFPNQAKRLEYRSPIDLHYINPERMMAKFWAELHRIDAPRPFPIETIVHEILPGMAKVNTFAEGEFEFGGRPYLSRDIALLSTVVYWFGTNVGNAFLEPQRHWLPEARRLPPLRQSAPSEREYLEKYQGRMRERDLVKYLWAHTCVPACNQHQDARGLGDHHQYHEEVISRDYAVVEGLMRWLGRQAGREFSTKWFEKLRRSQEASHERLRLRFEKAA